MQEETGEGGDGCVGVAHIYSFSQQVLDNMRAEQLHLD